MPIKRNPDLELAERVTRLERIDACQRALDRYCTAIDCRDFSAVAEFYSADVVYSSAGRELRGRRHVVSDLESRLARVPPGRHHLTNVVVTIEGDTAHSRSAWIRIRADDRPEVAIGLYDDVFEFTADGSLRCSSRTVVSLGTTALASTTAPTVIDRIPPSTT